MAWDDDLKGTALKIAECIENPLRVMAGPGTGKSFAMKRLIEEDDVDASRILAVTFTRNAAASLLDDLNSLEVEGSEDIRCGTLHRICFSLLSKGEVFAFSGRVPRPLVIFSDYACLRFEAEPMIEDLMAAGTFGGKRDCAKRIAAFEAAWARLQSDEPGWPDDAVDKEFETELISWLTFHEGMLIGELVPQALAYLRANPACDAMSAFDHVIVTSIRI